MGKRVSLNEVRRREPTEEIDGFDQRHLLKIRLRDGESSLPNFDVIHGVEIVSQEDTSVVLAFATEDGLNRVESRLSTLARDGTVTHKQLFYAIEAFDLWSPEDRTGAALREQGFPEIMPCILDVELLPQERLDRRDAILANFQGWLREQQIEFLDSLKQPSLIMVRLRCSLEQAEVLLRHRDVLTVDLPPRLGVSVQVLLTDVNRFPPPPPPPEDVPAVAVLDSGLTPGHPLVGAACGDAQGYLDPDRTVNDQSPWHGTFVGGIALYGDIHSCIQQGQFLPQLRLFSGKVFNDDGSDQTEFVEKAVEAAVRDLRDQYGCRVFNLSYGDLNKIYDGRHVRGLAYTLDRLTRELDVLFVVPTGNLQEDDLPDALRDSYPDYLLGDQARMLDPAPALNALTVGGLCLNESTAETQRRPETIEDVLVARSGQPFPMTRCGPSVNGAIKPDFVEHAGNVAQMRVVGRLRYRGLGVVSLNGGFTAGRPFSEDVGTSYAAPKVAHMAARLLVELPNASSRQLRAVLGVHARWLRPCENLLNPNNNSEGCERLLRLIGYGRVDDQALYRSLDRTVTLLAEDQIEDNQHHFFEVPIPDSFWSRGRRRREISVALAYNPYVYPHLYEQP